MRRAARAVAAALALGGGAPAWAQTSLDGGVEVATDENRRGLSWSGGRAAASADVLATAAGWEASARAVALRGAPRHGGADLVSDLAVGHRWELGAVRLRAQGIAHLFAGAEGRQDFVEAGLDADYSIGPVQFGAGLLVAPAQDAVGGSNLHVFASASAGVPGTPLTLSAGLGGTDGGDRDARADRLRPDGAYLNWRLGAELNRARWSLAVDYVGTNIDPDRIATPQDRRADAADRVIARARFGF